MSPPPESSVPPGTWRLHLLGVPSLAQGDAAHALADTTAVALAYVALEGRTSRAVLSALLWPGEPEATAHGHLHQLEHGLRRACAGSAPLEGEDSLVLSPRVEVDALRLPHASRPEELAGGELLAGLNVDASPELARWLADARSRVENWRRTARTAALARSEAAGDMVGALALAKAWTAREPGSEEAGQEVMRLNYLLGQRGAALETFERLERTLERELGVKPLPETLALARSIERGVRLPRAMTARRPLPLSVLRPPVLAGREAEWSALLEGWEGGEVLFVVGAPGVGKSRLIHDFAESRGRWARSEARPGDREVPFSSVIRSFRVWLAARPDVEIPDWVRRELSRLLPELAEPGEAPPLVPRELDRVRLFDALLEMSTRLNANIDTLVTDDMQYHSEAELALCEYGFGRLYPTGGTGPCRLIQGVRRGEASPALWALIGRMETAGMARMVEVRPLDTEGVRALLRGLELPGVERHAERLTRYTGGNPLYVVETVKYLVERGLVEGEWPERLPAPGRVGPLIQRRMEALSPEALRLARVAALARTQFSHALAAAVLEEGLPRVGEAALELEAAQVMTGECFTHDLLQEAVIGAIPEPLRRMLHLRLGEMLEGRAAPSVTIAHHWFEAGEYQRALPAMMRAATEDEEVLQPGATADLYARAAALLTEAGRHDEALRARTQEARCRQRAAAPVSAP